jgi:hypothetical protein
MAEADVVRLESSAASLTTEVASIEALLSELAQMLRDAAAAGADPARINAIADTIDGNVSRLSAAAVANTPGAAAKRR